MDSLNQGPLRVLRQSVLVLRGSLLLLAIGCGPSRGPEDAADGSGPGRAASSAAAATALENRDHSRAAEPPSLTAKASPIAPSGPVPLSPTSTPQDEQALSEALFAEDAGDADATAPPRDSAVATLRSDRLQLRGDLPPDQLVNFLRQVDVEMHNVVSGRKQLFDVGEANVELIRLAKLKLQAAKQLEQQAAPGTPQKSIAIRGTLQGLSHLASLGDLPAAESLEQTARAHVDSDDSAVALDSQLVLVGLAMERLRNGTSSDSAEILQLIERIASSQQTPDVSALMVMGQAQAVLQQYGDDAAAQEIRRRIIELFANHPNPDVGAMAIQLAGSPKFAGLDELLRELEHGQAITPEQWRSAVESLLADAADMAAVQYLASAALQFEAYGHDELAEATFEILLQPGRFDQRETDEIAVAAEARQTRRAIIGQQLQLELPSVDGRPLSLEDYAGRVVLMPFWAIAFPDSLGVLQALEQIRQQSQGKVEIVGMNLDAADAPAKEFLEQSPVKFRSFQSVSGAATGGNPIAKQFGVVSLPFIVIIDAKGQLSAINLTGLGLAEQVAELVSH